jgi:hypothetical protein
MGELCVVCCCWVDLPCWISIKFGWQWGAKKVAEFLLQAAKFSMVFVLFFLKNALVNTGRRMPKGGGYVGSKKKLLPLHYASFRELQSHDRSRSL